MAGCTWRVYVVSVRGSRLVWPGTGEGWGDGRAAVAWGTSVGSRVILGRQSSGTPPVAGLEHGQLSFLRGVLWDTIFCGYVLGSKHCSGSWLSRNLI